eukprot:gene10914-11069_t
MEGALAAAPTVANEVEPDGSAFAHGSAFVQDASATAAAAASGIQLTRQSVRSPAVLIEDPPAEQMQKQLEARCSNTAECTSQSSTAARHSTAGSCSNQGNSCSEQTSCMMQRSLQAAADAADKPADVVAGAKSPITSLHLVAGALHNLHLDSGVGGTSSPIDSDALPQQQVLLPELAEEGEPAGMPQFSQSLAEQAGPVDPLEGCDADDSEPEIICASSSNTACSSSDTIQELLSLVQQSDTAGSHPVPDADALLTPAGERSSPALADLQPGRRGSCSRAGDSTCDASTSSSLIDGPWETCTTAAAAEARTEASVSMPAQDAAALSTETSECVQVAQQDERAPVCQDGKDAVVTSPSLTGPGETGTATGLPACGVQQADHDPLVEAEEAPEPGPSSTAADSASASAVMPPAPGADRSPPGNLVWAAALHQLLSSSSASGKDTKWRLILGSGDRVGPFTAQQLTSWMLQGKAAPKGISKEEAAEAAADPSGLQVCGIVASDYNVQRLPGARFFKPLGQLVPAVAAAFAAAMEAALPPGMLPPGWQTYNKWSELEAQISWVGWVGGPAEARRCFKEARSAACRGSVQALVQQKTADTDQDGPASKQLGAAASAAEHDEGLWENLAEDDAWQPQLKGLNPAAQQQMLHGPHSLPLHGGSSNQGTDSWSTPSSVAAAASVSQRMPPKVQCFKKLRQQHRPGVCGTCGKAGHSAADCPGYCTRCMSPNHLASDCPREPATSFGSNTPTSSSSSSDGGTPVRRNRAAAIVDKWLPAAAKAGNTVELAEEATDWSYLRSPQDAPPLVQHQLGQQEPELAVHQSHQPQPRLYRDAVYGRTSARSGSSNARRCGAPPQPQHGPQRQQHGNSTGADVQPADILPCYAAAMHDEFPEYFPAAWWTFCRFSHRFNSWESFESDIAFPDEWSRVRYLQRRRHFQALSYLHQAKGPAAAAEAESSIPDAAVPVAALAASLTPAKGDIPAALELPGVLEQQHGSMDGCSSAAAEAAAGVPVTGPSPHSKGAEAGSGGTAAYQQEALLDMLFEKIPAYAALLLTNKPKVACLARVSAENLIELLEEPDPEIELDALYDAFVHYTQTSTLQQGSDGQSCTPNGLQHEADIRRSGAAVNAPDHEQPLQDAAQCPPVVGSTSAVAGSNVSSFGPQKPSAHCMQMAMTSTRASAVAAQPGSAVGTKDWAVALHQLLSSSSASGKDTKWRLILGSGDRVGPFTAQQLTSWLLQGKAAPKGISKEEAAEAAADPSGLQVCGIVASDYNVQRLPGARFFKPLGQLVPAVAAGMRYTPVTKADLAKGVPGPGWNDCSAFAASDSGGKAGLQVHSSNDGGRGQPCGSGLNSVSAAAATAGTAVGTAVERCAPASFLHASSLHPNPVASSKAAAPPEQLPGHHSSNQVRREQAVARVSPCCIGSSAAESSFAAASVTAAPCVLMAPPGAAAVPSVQRLPPGFDDGADVSNGHAGLMRQLNTPVVRPCDLHPSQVFLMDQAIPGMLPLRWQTMTSWDEVSNNLRRGPNYSSQFNTYNKLRREFQQCVGKDQASPPAAALEQEQAGMVDLNAVKPSDLYPELQYEMQVCLGTMLPDYWPTYQSWEEVAANLQAGSNFQEQLHMFDKVRLRMQRIVAEDRAVAQAAREAAALAAQKAAVGQIIGLPPPWSLQMQPSAASSAAPSATPGLGLNFLRQRSTAEQSTLAAIAIGATPGPTAALAPSLGAPLSTTSSHIMAQQVPSLSPAVAAMPGTFAAPALHQLISRSQQGHGSQQLANPTWQLPAAHNVSTADEEDDDLNELLRVLCV